MQWTGADHPKEMDISGVAEHLASESNRDPFNQQGHDTLLVQQVRRLRVFGWKTIDAVNIFHCD